MRFSRVRGGGVKASLQAGEVDVLRQCAAQLLELIDPPDLSGDPLAALVGMTGDDVERPDEPVLQRLLPDAYRGDPDAASDFRRYTDADLRTAKRAQAEAVLAVLPVGSGSLRLDRDQVDEWLGFLNDSRLALGTLLDVSENQQSVPEGDPRRDLFGVYAWLGWLQESLLSCVDPRKP